MFDLPTPEQLAALSDEDLAELLATFVSAFNDRLSAAGDNPSDDDVAELGRGTEAIKALRAATTERQTAAAARAAQLAAMAAEVNPEGTPAEGEGTGEGAAGTGDGEGTPATGAPANAGQPEGQPAADLGSTTQPNTGEATAAPDPNPGANGGTAGGEGVQAAAGAGASAATLATMQRNAPDASKPKAPAQAKRAGKVTILAAGGLEAQGISPGSQVAGLHQIAEMMVEKDRQTGPWMGPGEQRFPVARFNRELPKERLFSSKDGPEENMAKYESFDRTPKGIQAAGGLCAPTAGYYDQMVLAEAHRPVLEALANFGADRGGIRFNPPPTMGQITSGVGIVTAAQDLAGGGPANKNCFTVTCPAITEVTISAVYNCLTFGNFGARTFPELVEAWTKLALALQARTAEQMLLDAIAANSIPVTSNGLVGAGREILARLGQAAAGYRSRNRMPFDAPLRVMLPFWTIDLMKADYARSFTDEPGLVGLTDQEIAAFFMERHLNVSWYADSKTGGNQVFGAANPGVVITDLATTNASATVTSPAQAQFTAADIGRTIVGAGIPAAATITAVASATSATISANATATATGVTATIGRPVLGEFPALVFGYMFAEGTFLHLDGGTLDLGLVRDSTLNTTNQFRMFTETFENVAKVGPESLEIAFNLVPDGSYGGALTVQRPILT